jgi:hypothetical protein
MHTRSNTFRLAILFSLALATTASGAVDNPSLVICKVQYLQLPRAEYSRIFPTLGGVVKPEALRQCDLLITQRKAQLLAQARISTPSGTQGQTNVVFQMAYPPGSGKVFEGQVLINATPTVCADHHTINVATITDVAWPGESAPGMQVAKLPDPQHRNPKDHRYDWGLISSFVLASGSTTLLAVHEPTINNRYIGGADVVLVLFTASLNSPK